MCLRKLLKHRTKAIFVHLENFPRGLINPGRLSYRRLACFSKQLTVTQLIEDNGLDSSFMF